MKSTIRNTAVAAFMTAAFALPLTACSNGNPGASPTVTDKTVTLRDGSDVEVQLVDNPTSSPAANTADCAQNVRFHAYDAPIGSHNWGPSKAYSKSEEAFTAFVAGICEDPFKMAGSTEYYIAGAGMVATKQVAQANRYRADRELWRKDTTRFLGQVAEAQLLYSPKLYNSLGAIPGADRSQTPTPTSWGSQSVEAGQVLVLTMKDGTQLMFRVDCDFQPIIVKEFVSIPVVKPPKPAPPTPLCVEGPDKGKPVPPNGKCPPPPTKTETTPPSTSTTTPPPVTTTTTSPPPTTSTTTTSTTTTTTTTTTPPEETCPPDKPHGKPPVCKSDPSVDPGPSITTSVRPNPVPTGDPQPTQPPSPTGTTLPTPTGTSSVVVVPSDQGGPTQTATETPREVPTTEAPVPTGTQTESPAAPTGSQTCTPGSSLPTCPTVAEGAK